MEASRISIRPFKQRDAEDFVAWASDERVTKYLRWDPISSKEEAIKYLKEVAIPHPWRRSICIDDRTVGYVSVKPAIGDDDNHRAHISYGLNYMYWGQGICTKAIQMAIPMVFQQFPFLVRIQAFVQVDNFGSQKVLEKVGFLNEGLLRKYGFNKGEIRDMFVFSFLSSDLFKLGS